MCQHIHYTIASVAYQNASDTKGQKWPGQRYYTADIGRLSKLDLSKDKTVFQQTNHKKALDVKISEVS